MRDISPVKRCTRCGMATVVMVYDRGIGDDGEPYRQIYRDTIPHTEADCAAMTALIREEWPAQW